MNTNDSVLVTGAGGLVGSAIVRALSVQGFTDVWTTSRKAVDLENAEATDWFFHECKPVYVFHCAAKVGGIADNASRPADFLCANLAIQTNVFRAAHRVGVKKLLFLSSAACYPRAIDRPLVPADLMTGPLDETKSGYAMAKLAGMQMCQSFREQFGSNFFSVISNNVYGPGDKSSHVIPDLLRKYHVAKRTGVCKVECWGTGRARREFIYSEDLAQACLFLMDNYTDDGPINVGPGTDISMMVLAELVAAVVGYTGDTLWNSYKPEGAVKRLLDTYPMRELGWTPKTRLEIGLVETYRNLCQSL